MTIERNKSLRSLNSFQVEAYANAYVEIGSLKDIREIMLDPLYWKLPHMVLGGGSNLLFVDDFPGIILNNKLKGMQIVRELDSYVHVTCGAGESWDDLVAYAVDHFWGGIENLSLIPGSVGAAPIQNIGAYGTELKDTFLSLEAIDLDTGEINTFNIQQCNFGYRESIFKNELKNQYLILNVTLKLSKEPTLNLSYGKIRETLKREFEDEITLQSVREAVCSIRRSKLPDPERIGNGGSFFKNALINKQQFEHLARRFPEMPFFTTESELIKIPSAWLIEQCGWKGKKVGETGTFHNHALVLVNHGKATGREIYDFSETIIQSVSEKFDILLEREINTYILPSIQN